MACMIYIDDASVSGGFAQQGSRECKQQSYALKNINHTKIVILNLGGFLGQLNLGPAVPLDDRQETPQPWTPIEDDSDVLVDEVGPPQLSRTLIIRNTGCCLH